MGTEQKRAIVFDLHNVIFRPDIRAIIRILLAMPHKLKLFFFLLNPILLYHAFIFARYYGLGLGYLELLLEQHPRLQPYRQTILELVNAQVPIISTVDILHDLKRNGYPIYILSNMGGETLINLKKKYPEIFELVDGVHYFGPATGWTQKPQSSMFQTFLMRFNLEPHQVIFVDNSRRNIAKARELGITAIVYRSGCQLGSALQKAINRTDVFRDVANKI
jgi:HAD superfamily hydrolase (TIGR01509 family)